MSRFQHNHVVACLGQVGVCICVILGWVFVFVSYVGRCLYLCHTWVGVVFVSYVGGCLFVFVSYVGGCLYLCLSCAFNGI